MKITNQKKVEKARSRIANGTYTAQDEQMIPMLYGYLPHSLRILNAALCLSEDLEVPFPEAVCANKADQSYKNSNDISHSNDIKKTPDCDGDSTAEETKGKTDAADENPYDESVPLKLEHMKINIYADLGGFHFFIEDYHDAFKNFSQLFELSRKEGNQDIIKNFAEIKGCFLACAMICNIPVDVGTLIQDDVSLMLKVERCINCNFEGLYELLREDNLKKELSLTYRNNLEELAIASQRKDLLFKVSACNAIRHVLDGNLLPTVFLKSLRFARKDEIIILGEICGDILSGTAKRIELDYMKRCLRLISRSLSKEMKEIFESDARLSQYFSCKEITSHLWEDHTSLEDTSLTCIKTADSILLESVSSLSSKDDPQFIKREITLSTNPDYLKQLVAQLSVLAPGKDSFKSFQCVQYSDLLSEIRDPMTHALLHVLITKARHFAGKQELSTSLGLLTNSLEVLNQYGMQAGNIAHTNRIKNVLHHEMLSAKVQWEQIKADTSINIDTMRLCKACYHHKEQDPLPKKQIFRDIVSYLLNNKEWQFIIEERGNTEGITDFRELCYQIANVSVGLSKAGDAVRKHATELWNTVIKIICDDVNSGSQPLMAFERSSQGARRNPAIVTKLDFTMFIGTLKNNTVMSVLASCLISVINLLKSTEHIELKALYSHIWPTELDLENTVGKKEQFLSILKPLLEKIIALDPRNIVWLRNKADIFIVEGKYREAMKHYLEIGAMTSNMFSIPVPIHAWDEQVLRRMIDCCLRQKLYSQAVVLCQFIDPIDYQSVLKAIQDNGNSCDLIDTNYDCIWDPTILEFLIYAHSKRGEVEKKQFAIKTISQTELNSCSNPEALRQTIDIRKCKFLRFLTKYYWN